MLLAMSLSDHLFGGFCLFCFLLWYAARLLGRWDSGGVIRTTAKNKLLSIITGWLK